VTLQRLQTGRAGEQIACDHLIASGHALLARNYRTREGELDLITSHGDTLVFCEVKTLVVRDRSRHRLDPLESVTPSKRAKVRRMARIWLSSAEHRGRYADIRFDAIGVSLTPEGHLRDLHHVEAAF